MNRHPRLHEDHCNSEPREHVPVLPARCGFRGEEPDPAAAEAEPGEERDEPDDQPSGTSPVGLLLGEEVGRVAHARARLAGFIERSTFGNARSATSVISHSSTGDAEAMPATRFVGNWAWRVL